MFSLPFISYEHDIIADELQKLALGCHVHPVARLHDAVSPKPLQFRLVSVLVSQLAIATAPVVLECTHIHGLTQQVFLSAQPLLLSIKEGALVDVLARDRQPALAVNSPVYECASVLHFDDFAFLDDGLALVQLIIAEFAYVIDVAVIALDYGAAVLGGFRGLAPILQQGCLVGLSVDSVLLPMARPNLRSQLDAFAPWHRFLTVADKDRASLIEYLVELGHALELPLGIETALKILAPLDVPSLHLVEQITDLLAQLLELGQCLGQEYPQLHEAELVVAGCALKLPTALRGHYWTVTIHGSRLCHLLLLSGRLLSACACHPHLLQPNSTSQNYCRHDHRLFHRLILRSQIIESHHIQHQLLPLQLCVHFVADVHPVLVESREGLVGGPSADLGVGAHQLLQALQGVQHVLPLPAVVEVVVHQALVLVFILHIKGFGAVLKLLHLCLILVIGVDAVEGTPCLIIRKLVVLVIVGLEDRAGRLVHLLVDEAGRGAGNNGLQGQLFD